MSLIFLIGMPASGKTYWGQLLSKQYDYRLVDTDKEIERLKNRSIKQIFEESGEEYFRAEEYRLLLDLIKTSEGTTIIACGGGLATYNNNLELMQEAGSVIYLQADIHTLAERIKMEEQIRPMFVDVVNIEHRLTELYEARMPYYLGADCIVDTSGLSVDKLNEIVEKCIKQQ